ncbi:MAG: methylmalonyl-CoA epimerase [Smithellaceae bacterium]|nr:methylmalonyl-CoA epimerase [Smithellaceae bacterium]
MKTIKIDHIGLAVESIAKALGFYGDTLGLKLEGEEVVAGQRVKTAFLPTGDTEIELLESLDPEGPIAKFIEKKGEGIHHIAWEVADLDAALRELKGKGIRLIDAEPRPGAGGKRIAFIHPKDSFGVLVELCEKA